MSKFQQNQSKAPTIFSKASGEDAKASSNRLSPENLRKLDEELDLKNKEKNESKFSKELESLIFLGRLEKEFTISNFKFKLSTLSNVEQKNMIMYINSSKEDEKIFALKIATLSFAIKEINSIPFEVLIESDSFEDKVQFLNKLQSNLLDSLFSIYGELYKESNDIVSVEEIKKS